MKRGLFIALVMAAMAAGTGLAHPATSDELEESPPQYQLDLIVTTAQRENEKFFYTVDELTAEDLRQRDVQTAAQALNFLPGIRTKVARVGHGQYVCIRGFEQQHLLILVDGVPLYNPYDGLVELDHIPSEQIQAIRVVKGTSSATYGPNALGGVINIITKNPKGKANRGMVAEFGQNKTINIRLHHGFRAGPMDIRFSGNRACSDGFRLAQDFQETEVPKLPDGQDLLHYEDGGRRDNSDYAKTAGHLALSYLPGEKFNLTLSGSLVDNEWGVATHPFYNAKKNKSRIRYWRFTEWRQGMANLSAVYRPRKGLTARAGTFYNKYDNTLDSYDDDTYTSQEKGYAYHSIYDDHALGGHFQLAGDLGRAGHVTLGGGILQDVHRDTPDEGQPTGEFQMRTWWVGLQDQARISERVSAALGLNYALLDKRKAADLTDAGEDFATLNPHICVALLTSPISRVYLSLAHQTGFPTMKQLYGEDGNPQLKAQKTNHLELGTEWVVSAQTRFDGALFYDWVSDLIEGNYLSRTTVNVEKAHLFGGEVSYQYSPAKALHIALSYSCLYTENMSDQRPGEYLQFRPEHTLDWRLSLRLLEKCKILFYGSALSRQHFYDDFNDRRLSHLPAYCVANLTFRWQPLSYMEPFLSVSNLFDADYQEVYTSPSPGRDVHGGLRMSW